MNAIPKAITKAVQKVLPKKDNSLPTTSSLLVDRAGFPSSCGIVVIYNLRAAQGVDWSKLSADVRESYKDNLGEGYGIVTASTADYQRQEEAALRAIGFTADTTVVNPNSGNSITLWHLDTENVYRDPDDYHDDDYDPF